VFFLHYISAELRRRRGRTILTALGLAIGVGLVVVVSALSDGLDKAQDEVLQPLTGIRLPRGEPGERFERDDLISTSQLSFSERRAEKVAALDGVAGVATSLTLNSIHVEGTVPDRSDVVGPGAGPGVGPRNIDFRNFSVTGIDVSNSELAQVRPSQITSGRYLTGSRRSSGSSASPSRRSVARRRTCTWSWDGSRSSRTARAA
jgi:hypothetical protein